MTTAPASPIRPTPGEASVPTAVPLTSLRPGDRGRVCGFRTEGDDADFVRALGIHDACDLRICRSKGVCIVQVSGENGSGCRVAIDTRLAKDLLVTPLTLGGDAVG
ncbi:MAG: FeoA domain-containing protein [Phycisphaerales bacterium]